MKRQVYTLILLMLLCVEVLAQNDNPFKVSGYIQTQMEASNGEDISYGIRRGRVKLQYSQSIAKGVFQIDATEKGIGVKDAYIRVDEPFLRVFSLTLGLFNPPFGEEICLSSALRESPERTSLYRNLFPQERDLGGMLSIQVPETSKLNGLKLEAGLFSGNGIRQDSDSRLDFIGHLKYERDCGDWIWGLGSSLYHGAVNNADSLVYRIENGIWKSQEAEINSLNERMYFGLNAKVSVKTAWGVSKLRGEFLFGSQPSQEGSFRSPIGNSYNPEEPFNHIREFYGWHIYYVQTLHSLPLSSVVKYSFMDCNSEIAGGEIANPTDLSRSALGVGLLWDFADYLGLMAYYEFNFNEKTNKIAEYSRDLQDDVFTLRLQYKF